MVMPKDAVLKSLTTEEKIELIHGRGPWHTTEVGGLNAVMMTDGPHGLRKQSDVNTGINDSAKATCFPTACAVASSWNTDNARLMGECMGDEALAESVSVILGPGVNIKRSPLCGRNFEYYSEDPCLAGHMAAEFINGVQSRNVGCSLKHFAVNGQETRRMTVDTIVDERALREIYLSAFEYAIKNARPATVMAAYNKVNGESCTQNKRLLTEILRGEWKFDGLVVSDWGAVYDAVKAVNAGCDLEMPDSKGYHVRQLKAAAESGELDLKALDRAAGKVIELVEKYGKNEKISVDFDKHHNVARQIENDSAVLLKNEENILPLSKNKKYLIVGELADKLRFQGAGSSHINTGKVNNFLETLKSNGVDYLYCRGYSVSGDKVEAYTQNIAVEAAKKFDEIIFFGGLTDQFEGEGYDRVKLEMPSCQQVLLDKLYAVNKNIVFVAFGGSPFAMPFLGSVKGLLHMYLGGQAVAESAFDVLFGDVCPSGRLAETYPEKLTDVPAFLYYADKMRSVELRESIFVGYRYYQTFDVQVRFPFGYGLSYTSFSYSNMSVSDADGKKTVSVKVTNGGERDGKEVLQLYVENPESSLMRPIRELRAFRKIFLSKGESRTETFVLDDGAFAFYDTERKEFSAVNGKYRIVFGKNVSEEAISAETEITGKKIVKQNDRKDYPSYFRKPELSFTVTDAEFFKLTGRSCSIADTVAERGNFTMQSTLGDMYDKVWLVRLIVKSFTKKFVKNSESKSINDPAVQMSIHGAVETPLVSLISVGGISENLIEFLLEYSNGHRAKAFAALRSKKKN